MFDHMLYVVDAYYLLFEHYLPLRIDVLIRNDLSLFESLSNFLHTKTDCFGFSCILIDIIEGDNSSNALLDVICV